VSAQAIDQLFVSSTALRSVNFFNGRLLTGDDLRREQATQEARRQRLGRLVGGGIAEGFEVAVTGGTSTASRPVVTVSAGRALAPSGAALELQNDVDIALYRSDPPPGAEPGALFGDCQPFAPGTYTAGAGVYVLTVAPAARGEGRAEVNGLGNATATCNVGLQAEALKFRLIRLALDVTELADKAHLRNRIAYACFGTDELAEEVADPFGPPHATYGLVDTLRAQTMTDDEVPLATIGWSIDDGIQFVDLWSVRRRVTRPAATETWPDFVDDRRRAEGEARFLQFQAQILERRDGKLPASVVATAEFRRLPALGLVPLGGPGTPPGFSLGTFFSGLKTRDPLFLESARVAALIRESFLFPPIDTASAELVWIYEVRANIEPDPPTATITQPYLIFANGQLPYAGDPRFDLAYWSYANYALTA
jgi:hypothetical protein